MNWKKRSYSIKYLLYFYYHIGLQDSKRYIDNSLNTVNTYDVSPFHEGLQARGNINADRIKNFLNITS